MAPLPVTVTITGAVRSSRTVRLAEPVNVLPDTVRVVASSTVYVPSPAIDPSLLRPSHVQVCAPAAEVDPSSAPGPRTVVPEELRTRTTTCCGTSSQYDTVALS